MDHESHSLKIHLTQSILDKLSKYNIEEIEVHVHQNVIGDPHDLIAGKLATLTNSVKEVTIYHCGVRESNQLDFTLDDIKEYLNTFEAMINNQFLRSSIKTQSVET